jgi:hypothetical protein
VVEVMAVAIEEEEVVSEEETILEAEEAASLRVASALSSNQETARKDNSAISFTQII